MRYLFLVTEKYSANGICVKAVMQKLISEGHQVDCISNMEFDEPHYFCKYGISYYGIRPRLVYNISSRILRSKDNRFIKYIISLFGFVFNKIQLLLAIPTWPVISRGYSKRIYLQAKQLYEKRHYDYIIPVYTQIDTIIAAKKIKEKYPEIKYVPYFLDSLAGGYGPKMFSKEWIIKRGLKWERKLLQNADLIIMMQSSKNFYNSKKDILFYFDKTYIMKRFKRELGISIHEYINTIRIYNSLAYFKDNNYVLSIALNNGFNSLEFFSETFKKIMGVSPTVYKNYLEHLDISNEKFEKIINNVYRISSIKFNALDYLSHRKRDVSGYVKILKFK